VIKNGETCLPGRQERKSLDEFYTFRTIHVLGLQLFQPYGKAINNSSKIATKK